MIKERYCSCEVAMLLREKGFSEPVRSFYLIDDAHNNAVNVTYTITYRNVNRAKAILRPTHQMACDWLRYIYDLHIIVYPYKRGNNKGWCCQVYKTYNILGQNKYTNETCNSYGEAIESALKYSLENLV